MKTPVRRAVEREFAILQKTYGAVVRQLRLQAGLSQKTVAQKSKISESVVRRIERGHGNPTITNLFNIAEALGTRASRMLEQAQEMRVDLTQRRRRKGLPRVR